MDSSQWDARYEASDLVWAPTPNVWVAEATADLPPGRALDLAAGEGRNAIWLAERGWSAVAVDFSAVAVERARRLAQERLGAAVERITFHVADVLHYSPDAEPYDLVVLAYLHLPSPDRRVAVRSAAQSVAPNGLLVVVGHHLDNLTQGAGGPQDAAVLYTPSDLVADLEGTGLVVERADRVLRTVEDVDAVRSAIDVVLVARRPPTD